MVIVVVKRSSVGSFNVEVSVFSLFALHLCVHNLPHFTRCMPVGNCCWLCQTSLSTHLGSFEHSENSSLWDARPQLPSSDHSFSRSVSEESQANGSKKKRATHDSPSSWWSRGHSTSWKARTRRAVMNQWSLDSSSHPSNNSRSASINSRCWQSLPFPPGTAIPLSLSLPFSFNHC